MTMGKSRGFLANERRVVQIAGPDATSFLQNLVTNDVKDEAQGLIYAALLTPQGKYLADFFLLRRDEAWLMDVHADQAADVYRRLSLYKLRANVTLEQTGLQVWQIWDGAGEADPRHSALGARVIADQAPDFASIDPAHYDELRVAHAVPEAMRDLHAEDAFVLEYGFERLQGVDFRKGCYVGQEVTARMKHKTELRKGLRRVGVSGDAQEGAEIVAGGKVAGRLGTIAGGQALAYLRFDRIQDEMTAGAARITPLE